jgi:lipoprotein-anchoring transpeptidase ErfK/SrfK
VRQRSAPRFTVALVALIAVAGAACGGGGDDDAQVAEPPESTATTAAAPGQPAQTTLAPDTSWVASANGPEVAVFPEPDAPEPSHTLANPNENGAPLVFLVDGPDVDGHWLPVHLPVRPNGSKGWVRTGDVTLARNQYRITIELAAHRLTVHRGDQVSLETAIGVGTADTPTPGGIYYIKELLQPPNPDGDYGPYAYGLSGFSNNPELATFNGGSGVIGIHGTNDPDSIGNDVSHGCIRVPNEVITQMADSLPLGTPVAIQA